MKKYTVLCAVLLLLQHILFSQELTGYDIMKKADERNKPKTTEFTIEMHLVNAKGKVRKRVLSVHQKEYDSGTKKVMVFLRPADVKGFGYLSISHNDGTDDDRWLYVPALKKVRRISGSSSKDSFMNSEFTYDDISGYALEAHDYTLLGTDTVDGRTAWKIEVIPHDKKQYSKYISWIDQESLLTIQAEFYDQQKEQLKVLRAYNIQQENGYWTAKKLIMENVQTKHKTVIQTLKTKYNTEIPDSRFRTSALESGTIR